MAEIKSKFSKPALTVEQQVDLLISRGLRIDDRELASHYLRFIGYYRLSAYYIPFLEPEANTDNHHFKRSTSFDKILDLYIFDRKLRLLVMDAVERIEVATRATISNTASVKYGSHWFLEQKYFDSEFNHNMFLEQIESILAKDQPETFIQHYKNNYNLDIDIEVYSEGRRIGIAN